MLNTATHIFCRRSLSSLSLSPLLLKIPADYVPPKPEWISRAGGVYIANKGAPALPAPAAEDLARDAFRALAVFGKR